MCKTCYHVLILPRSHFTTFSFYRVLTLNYQARPTSVTPIRKMSLSTLRHYSPLESLPEEVLENIYLNVIHDSGPVTMMSLFLVSTMLRNKLQTPKIKRNLVGKALCVLPGQESSPNFMLPGWVEKWKGLRTLQYQVLTSEWFTLRTYKDTLIHTYSSFLSNLCINMIIRLQTIGEINSGRMRGDIPEQIRIHEINMRRMQFGNVQILPCIHLQIEDAFNDSTLMSEPHSTFQSISTGIPDSPTFEFNPVTLEIRTFSPQGAGGPNYGPAGGFPNSGYRQDLANCQRGPWAENNVLPCYLPSKLLRGPWTDDKLDLLHILRRRGLDVAPDDRYLASEGLMHALKEHNMRAVDLLVPGMGRHSGPPIPARSTCMARIPTACVHLDVSVNEHHVNYAIEQMDCEPRVLQRLIFASPDRMHKDPKFWDVKNVQWVHRRAGKAGQQRNEKADWLERCLNQTRHCMFSLSDQD